MATKTMQPHDLEGYYPSDNDNNRTWPKGNRVFSQSVEHSSTVKLFYSAVKCIICLGPAARIMHEKIIEKVVG